MAAIRSVFALAPHSDPIDCLSSATRDFSFLCNASIK